MSFSKLTRQLRREATKNPKKAAFLGLVFAIALWFWSPLVWGWIAKEDRTAVTAPHAAQPAIAPTVTPGTSNTTPDAAKVVRHSWAQLARWMDNDRLTRAVGLTDHARDPFLATEPPEEKAIVDPDEQEAADVTPEGLGLVLSSTIVGPQRRVALISGRPYREKDVVELVRDDKEINFVIERIEPRRVVLRRGGKGFELTTKPNNVSSQIQQAN